MSSSSYANLTVAEGERKLSNLKEITNEPHGPSQCRNGVSVDLYIDFPR